MRISWIDRWRGFLILSIVIFHVVGVGIISGNGNIVRWLKMIQTFISTYHVVSFFVIAAILWPTTNVPIDKFLIKKAKRLLIPYAVFGSAMVVLFYLSEKFTGDSKYYSGLNMFTWYDPLLALIHGGGWPKGIGSKVLGPLWFLPCFLSAQIFFYILNVVCTTSGRWFIAASVFFTCRLFLVYFKYDFNLFGIGMAIGYVVLMCIARGVVETKKLDVKKMKRLPHCYIIVTFGCLFIAGLLKMVDWKPIPAVFNGIILSSFAIVGSALIAKSINAEILSCLGRYSLGIFVMHKFFLVALQAPTAHLKFCFCNGIFIGLFSTVAISCVVIFASIVAWKVLCRIAPFLIGETKQSYKEFKR